MDKINTPPDVGRIGLVGADEHGILKSEYSTSLDPKVKTIFKHCNVCGSRFTPQRHNHSLCDQCWSYDQVGRAIESIRHLIREVSHV